MVEFIMSKHISTSNLFFITLTITSLLLRVPAVSSSACAEFSSTYHQLLLSLRLPVEIAEAASHVTIECQHADLRHFFSRCYSMLYRWCNVGSAGVNSILPCGADWQSVSGLNRIDSLQTLLVHARRFQQRLLRATGRNGPKRLLIYRPSARGEGWGNRVMALTAAYAAALLSRRTFHMVFDRHDPVLSAVDFRWFPPSAILDASSSHRSARCLSLAAALGDPPLNFIPRHKLRSGGSVTWLHSLVVPGLDDEVAWLGRLDESRASSDRCGGGNVLYVSGASAMQHSHDRSLRCTDQDHGGVWGSSSIVFYSSYDSFWGALLERPATGMLLKRLLLPLSLDDAANISWSAAYAHLRAWLAFGAFASAVILPSARVAGVDTAAAASSSAAAASASTHCLHISCAQCLGVAVRRGRPWNSDYVIVDDDGDSRMLTCARMWLHNATEVSAHSAAAHGVCAFVAADDADVLQHWIEALSRDGAFIGHTPGSDGSHTGTQHSARAGMPMEHAVLRSYKDWFSLACCSRDALLSDNSSFGYSAIALAAQRWLREGACSLKDITPLMQQPPPAPVCVRRLWQGHVCPAMPPLESGMVAC